MSEVQKYIPPEEGRNLTPQSNEVLNKVDIEPDDPEKPARGDRGDVETEQVGNPTYPDQMDWTFCGGVLNPYEQKKGEGSWANEESVALQRAKDKISTEVSSSEGVLVDAGCGMGRLSVEFAPMFGSVIAVEPDERRMQEALSQVISSGLVEKIELQNTTIQKMNVENADSALCSHIIQHVPAESIPGILEKLNGSLKDGGMLILSTNNSGQENDRYTKLYWNGVENLEEEITQEEFASLHGNQEGVLPIHWFSRGSIEKILQEGGFKIEDVYYYHNLDGEEGEGGRDVQIIARKLAT